MTNKATCIAKSFLFFRFLISAVNFLCLLDGMGP